jgi:hypothetical protein
MCVNCVHIGILVVVAGLVRGGLMWLRGKLGV